MAHTLHLIGNAHLDPVWLWRWQEGFAEAKATFLSALQRMDEFDGFVFTCAGAQIYKWVEENEPELFEKVRRRVAEGRWVIVGGWWIQPDCNIPSGESFARHALYSQRYFSSRFGRRAKVGYNVDSFGHNGMLPQLLKKSGMDAYVFMRPGDHEKPGVPQLFLWEGMDGTRVPAFKIYRHYGTTNRDAGRAVRDAVESHRARAEEAGHDMMLFYGVGNHGGGPTVRALEEIERMRAEGFAEIKYSDPQTFFQGIDPSGLPVVRDDLQHHASGCYSAVSKVKALNRRAEIRLLGAEKFSAMAGLTLGLPDATQKLAEAWEEVLFSQFHDSMGGCSIEPVYQDAEEMMGCALHSAAKVLNGALQKFSWAVDTSRGGPAINSKDMDFALWERDNLGTPFVVFNPHSYPVEAPVVINAKVRGVEDIDGNPVALQTVRSLRTNGREDKYSTLILAKAPAMGLSTYWLYRDVEKPGYALPGSLAASENALENDFLKLTVDAHDGSIHLRDKRTGKEVFSRPAAVPVVIDEIDSDTWAHNIFSFRKEIARFADADVCLLESGPLRAVLRVTNYYNSSGVRQDFTLYRNSSYVDVAVKLNWQEKHKMLKLSFPLGADCDRATYEIPYGTIVRPSSGEEEPGQRFIDLSGDAHGLTLCNDAKYAYDTFDGEIRLTACRSPLYADHYGARDGLNEHTDQGEQYFSYRLVPHGGNWRSVNAPMLADTLCDPLTGVLESYHDGPLHGNESLLEVMGEGVAAAAFKKSEDGKGYILRLSERFGKPACASVRIPALNVSMMTSLCAHEIQTWRFEGGQARIVNLLEE